MSNKWFNMDSMTEVTFYEAIEYLSESIDVECHIEDADGVALSWSRYSIEDMFDKAIPIFEIINGKWYAVNDTILHGSGIEFYYEGGE